MGRIILGILQRAIANSQGPNWDVIVVVYLSGYMDYNALLSATYGGAHRSLSLADPWPGLAWPGHR